MHPTRRDLLRTLSGLACLGLSRATIAAQERLNIPRRLFGLQAYSYAIRFRQQPGANDPLQLIQFTSEQGFASVQLQLGNRDADYLTRVRDTATRLGISLEGLLSAPMTENDSDRFDADLRANRSAGIEVVRTVVSTGRRYEIFRSADDFRRFQTQAAGTLARIVRSADRNRVKVAVENHKDYRTNEFVDALRRLDSEFVGVCLDTGNNIALLEDPWQTVDALAPYTMTVHIKDMAVEQADNGFLLAEVPLGSGTLDLRRIVERIHRAKPQARFQLEMITRNPLSIPCLTDDYWRTMADVPGVDLARTLTFVRQRARRANDLPRIDRLEPAGQARLEQDHVARSRQWGNENLFRA